MRDTEVACLELLMFGEIDTGAALDTYLRNDKI